MALQWGDRWAQRPAGDSDCGNHSPVQFGDGEGVEKWNMPLSYRDVTAVSGDCGGESRDGLFETGKIHGIIGRNGSGKNRIV